MFNDTHQVSHLFRGDTTAILTTLSTKNAVRQRRYCLPRFLGFFPRDALFLSCIIVSAA